MAYQGVREQWSNGRREPASWIMQVERVSVTTSNLCMVLSRRSSFFFFVVSLVVVHRSIIAVLFWPGETKWSAVDWCLVLFCCLFKLRGYQLLLIPACVFSGG